MPGDILVLMPGDPGSCGRQAAGIAHLMVDESALTGESMPVIKMEEPLDKPDVPLGDRFNMVYMGTVVTGGSGLAVVVGTGRQTEIGTIQALVGETKPPKPPCNVNFDVLGNQMVLLSGGICGMVFLMGLARGYGWLQMLKTSISLAVAAVPEGLPTVATTTLALGIRNMARQRVLVRHLDAVETLGAIQVICLDKTGTLTLNCMSVLEVYSGGHRLTLADDAFYENGSRMDPRQREELVRLIQIAVLCNETEVNGAEGNYEVKGSPTENALVHLAFAAGVEVSALRRQYPRERVEYRTEKQSYMRTIHSAEGDKKLVAVKGSPVEVLEMCGWWIKDGKRLPLTEADRTALLIENDHMAGDALRVLGFAYWETAQADLVPANELIWLWTDRHGGPVEAGDEGAHRLVSPGRHKYGDDHR